MILKRLGIRILRRVRVWVRNYFDIEDHLDYNYMYPDNPTRSRLIKKLSNWWWLDWWWKKE